MDANRPNRANWRILSQAALGHPGHLGREDANRLDQVNRKNLSCRAQGQVGQMDANQLNRTNWRILSQAALGHLGKMDAVDAKEPKGLRTNQIMTRVTTEKVKGRDLK
ncbi:hypothetical protein KI387_029721, partial [Taxus chinensis]